MEFEKDLVMSLYVAFYWIVLIVGLCCVYVGFIRLRFLLFLLFILILIGVFIYMISDSINYWILNKISRNEDVEDSHEGMEQTSKSKKYSSVRSVKIHHDLYNRALMLKNSFDKEEKDIFSLIETIFPHPQITNEKFLKDVEKLHEVFYSKFDSLYMYCKMYPHEDESSRQTVKEEFEDLKKIFNALEGLKMELSKLLIDSTDIDDLLKDIHYSRDNLKNYAENNNDCAHDELFLKEGEFYKNMYKNMDSNNSDKLHDLQKEINDKYEKEGFSEELLDEQVELNKRNNYV